MIQISQNLTGSKSNRDSAYDFLKKDPRTSICVILLTNRKKQTNGHENNTTLVEIINVCTSKIQLVHYILVNEKDRNSKNASFYKHIFNN